MIPEFPVKEGVGMESGHNLPGGGRFYGSAPMKAVTIVLVAAIIFGWGAGALVPRTLLAAEATTNPVVATIGKHKITEQDMDAAVLQGLSTGQLYDLRDR